MLNSKTKCFQNRFVAARVQSGPHTDVPDYIEQTGQRHTGDITKSCKSMVRSCRILDLNFFPHADGRMAETSLTLLGRLQQAPDPASWQRLVDIYAPLIGRWLAQSPLQKADHEDLT